MIITEEAQETLEQKPKEFATLIDSLQDYKGVGGCLLEALNLFVEPVGMYIRFTEDFIEDVGKLQQEGVWT